MNLRILHPNHLQPGRQQPSP